MMLNITFGCERNPIVAFRGFARVTGSSGAFSRTAG